MRLEDLMRSGLTDGRADISGTEYMILAKSIERRRKSKS